MLTIRQLVGDPASTQHLDSGADVLDHPGFDQLLGRHLGTLGEPAQPSQVHYREGLLPAVLESAKFRDPHGELGLTALESLGQVHGSAGALPLLATAGSLSMPRTGPTAHPLARLV